MLPPSLPKHPPKGALPPLAAFSPLPSLILIFVAAVNDLERYQKEIGAASMQWRREEGGEFFARQEKNRRELWKETEEVNAITKGEEKTAATAVFSLFLRVSLNID